jgi:predicted kinase
MPTVVFMIGAGGSGKSTALAKSEWANLPVVNSDAFIEVHPIWVDNGDKLEPKQRWGLLLRQKRGWNYPSNL